MGTRGTKSPKRELSPYIGHTVVRYVRAAGGDEAVSAVLAKAGVDLTREDLKDPNRWYSSAEVTAIAAARRRAPRRRRHRPAHR